MMKNICHDQRAKRGFGERQGATVQDDINMRTGKDFRFHNTGNHLFQITGSRSQLDDLAFDVREIFPDAFIPFAV